MTIKGFFAFSLGYAICALAVAAVFHGGGVGYAVASLDLIVGHAGSLKSKLHWFLVVGIIAYLVDRNGWTRARLGDLAIASVACMFFAFAFSTTKSTLPHVIPFWADPAFANIDRVLHFGAEPYEFVHRFASSISADWVVTVYFLVWAGIAIFFPVWLILVDKDAGRIRRYLLLYVLTWLIVGNLLAGAFMSAGPIYYDRLLGGDTFAPLIALLAESGITDSAMGGVQSGLWELYAGERLGVGSGVSAFPSVHVAIATLVTIYLAERSRYLLVVGLLYWSVIQFLSVYVGFHYAMDGYASTVIVGVMWAALRRSGTVPTTSVRSAQIAM